MFLKGREAILRQPSHKAQIYIPAENTAQIIATLETYRDACNYISNEIFKTKVLDRASLHTSYYYFLRKHTG
jgi:hypothetical protein